MVDTATARFGARKQSLGSNVNTWGDTKLNEVLDVFDRGAKGFQSIALTGDLTLAWTSYATTNQGQVQTIKLTGSLSSPASLIVPSREWAFTVINAAGQTVTVRTSAGVGVEIPTGYQAALYCDAVDVYNAAPTVLTGSLRISGDVRVNGQINNLAAASADSDAVNKAQMDTAIAAATTSTSPGTLRITASDTTAKFLNSALTVSGSLTKAVLNPGANETLDISYTAPPPYLIDGGIKTANFTVQPGYKYLVDCRAGPFTATLHASEWNAVSDYAEVTAVGSFPLTLAQGAAPTKINGAAADVTNLGTPGEIRIQYVDAAYGVRVDFLSTVVPSPGAIIYTANNFGGL